MDASQDNITSVVHNDLPGQPHSDMAPLDLVKRKRDDDDVTPKEAKIPRQETMPESRLYRFESSLKEYGKISDDEAKVRDALTIFFMSKRPELDTYSGRYKNVLNDIIVKVSTTLIDCQNDVANSFDGKITQDLLQQGRSKLAYEMICFLKTKVIAFFKTRSPTRQDVIDAFEKWRGELYRARLHLRRPLVNDAMRRLLMEEITLAKSCHDEAYMKKFKNMLNVIGNLKYNMTSPSVFICAPSGSGKSLFGVDLGAHVPSLHWLHRPTKQSKYQPFDGISNRINEAIKKDLKEIFSDDSVDDDSTTLKCVSTMTDARFRSVHEIVTLFEDLAEIMDANPHMTWLEAQSLLKQVPEGKMSIRQGKKIISGLQKKWNFPLSVFIDEYSLPRQTISPYETHRLKFTRSINRAIGVIPILTGTDARAIDFCSKPDGGSRSSDELWCIVVNDLPAFNLKVLSDRCSVIEEKLGLLEGASHPILHFFEFLERIRLYENPWIIDMALECFEAMGKEKLLSWNGSLDVLLRFLASKLKRHKALPEEFRLGQVGYIMSHSMDANGKITVNHFNESCINGHLARLTGFADYYGDPFISIANIWGTRSYYLMRTVKYKPRSNFTPFFMAPLSGLMLFELDLSDESGLDRVFSGINCFNAVYSAFEPSKLLTLTNATGGKNTGSQLEVLYHAAAVVASRANGLKELNFRQFLERFIRELESDPEDQQKPLIIKGHHEFDARRVPILAPMSAPGWPKSVVELLKHSPDSQTILYGVFKPSFNNEPVDSIIYECEAAPYTTPEPIIINKALSSEQRDFYKKTYKSPLPGEEGQGNVIREECRLADFGRRHANKVYGYLGSSLNVHGTSLKSVSIVGECKQYRNDLTLDDLKDIIDKFDNVKECRTFMVLCLSTSAFNNETVYNAKCTTINSKKETERIRTLDYMNQRGYYFWFVDKGENDSYDLKPIPSQMSNENNGDGYPFKDVIVIGCAVMWTESALKNVRDSWSKFKNDIVDKKNREKREIVINVPIDGDYY